MKKDKIYMGISCGMNALLRPTLYNSFHRCGNGDCSGKFENSVETEIGLVIAGEASATVALDIISMCESRKDCVAFISPEQADVVNNSGNEADAVVEFRNTLGSTSYAVMDSGYKYQYDRYNDVFRYVPLNADMAVLCAATEANRDAWFSPDGFTRGIVRNVVRLPFNPRQSERIRMF